MLSKTVHILTVNETRLDSSIQNGEVSIPGYILLEGNRNAMVWPSILGTQ